MPLFERSGRKLVLTDAGHLALGFADEIFRLGTELNEALKGRPSGRPLQLSVGVVDHDAPMLLPAEGSALRGAFMHWLDRQWIRTRIVGEFEDQALIQAFGQSGAGVFMAPSVVEAEIARQHAVETIGATTEVRERYYAISTERRLRHPGVLAVSQTARVELLGAQESLPPELRGLLTAG